LNEATLFSAISLNNFIVSFVIVFSSLLYKNNLCCSAPFVAVHNNIVFTTQCQGFFENNANNAPNRLCLTNSNSFY